MVAWSFFKIDSNGNRLLVQNYLSYLCSVPIGVEYKKPAWQGDIIVWHTV